MLFFRPPTFRFDRNSPTDRDSSVTTEDRISVDLSS